MNLLRCASLVVRGSLKQYTDTPPVLDRFKKWFLYGISGEASYVCAKDFIELKGPYQPGQNRRL